MATSAYEFRLTNRKLAVSLVLAVVPLSLFAILTITQHSEVMEKSVGSQSQATAEGIAAEINQFVRGHVIEANLMASDSAVVATVQAANRASANLTDAALKAKIEQTEADWNKPAGVALVNGILSSVASKALRRKLNVDQQFLRITVTDGSGTTVAATHKTLDYYQADEDYWQNIHAQGRGAISLTDVLYDEASKASYIGVGVPVVNEEYEFLGTFDALVDVSALGPMLKRPRAKTGARILLVKSDGSIISSTEGQGLGAAVKSPEYAAVVDAVRSIEAQPAGFVTATLPGAGETLIAFADAGLRGDFKSLGWTVLVAQRTSEALAPIRSTARMVLALGLLGLISVAFLLVYLSVHQRDDPGDEGFHPTAIAEPSTGLATANEAGSELKTEGTGS